MHTLDLPAGTLEYDDRGSGPPVVLLHGLLMDHTLWDQVLPLLPSGFRYLRPVLPLGAHRIAMRPDADLGLDGLTRLVHDVLVALDLHDVTLVHADWGGGLFLTARGLDARVTRQVLLPCEAFDNFPPGLPGRAAAVATRLPYGVQLACRQLRVAPLQRLPLLYGQMTRRRLPRDLMRRWTEPALRDPLVRRDLKKYARSHVDGPRLVADTEALRHFAGDALVLWAPENKVMPPEHGRRLAALLPRGRLVELPGVAVLAMLDDPEAVARELGGFLTEQSPTDSQPPAALR
jgi:pimeloyl-ACP methyl ester carboxylesterase